MIATLVLLSGVLVVVFLNLVAIQRNKLPIFVFPSVTLASAAVGWLTITPESIFFFSGDFLLYLKEGSEIQSDWALAWSRLEEGDTRLFIKLLIALMNYLPFPAEIGIVIVSSLVYGSVSTMTQIVTLFAYNVRSGLITMLFLILTPSLIFQGSAYREPYFLLGLTTIMLAASLNMRDTCRPYLAPALATAGSILSIIVRPELGASLMVPGALVVLAHTAWVCRLIPGRRKTELGWSAILGSALVFLAFMVLIPSRRTSPSQLAVARQELAKTADSGYLADSAAAEPTYSDYLLRTLLGPFPMELWLSPNDPVASIALTSHLTRWLLALACLTIAVWKIPNFYTLFSGLLTAGSVIIFASTIGNYGTLMRFRDVPIIALTPLVVVMCERYALKIRSLLESIRNQ